jgi:hypothetical protein
MELARPAYVVVAVRDIIGYSFFRAFWRALGGMSLGSDPGFLVRIHAGTVAGAVPVIRAA